MGRLAMVIHGLWEWRQWVIPVHFILPIRNKKKNRGKIDDIA